VRQVHADLVGAAGEELRLEERELLAARHAPEDGLGFLSFPRDRDALVALRIDALGERQRDPLGLVAEAPRTPAR
jgi:hypothetical protein